MVVVDIKIQRVDGAVEAQSSHWIHDATVLRNRPAEWQLYASPPFVVHPKRGIRSGTGRVIATSLRSFISSARLLAVSLASRYSLPTAQPSQVEQLQ